jgi:pantetheine-phosphate adenylyltransferase
VSAKGPRIALFPGSFDPFTNGHAELVARASRLFDEVVVAIGRHPSRQPLFTLDERLDLLRASTAAHANVRVDSYDGLLIEFAARVGACAVVRGLRSGVDFDYELPIAQANRTMRAHIETVFLPTAPEHAFISASIVREIAGHRGPTAHLVPAPVAEALATKFPATKGSHERG